MEDCIPPPPQHIHKRQSNNRDLRGRAAVDQELQITHQNQQIWQRTLIWRLEGTQTQSYLSGK